MPWLEAAMERMPIFSELGIKREVHGAISHPPDGNPLVGPAPGVKNYWCCLRDADRHRLGARPHPRARPLDGARSRRHLHARIRPAPFRSPMPPRIGKSSKAKEDYCLRHEIPFPHFNRLAGRPIKPSPFYERLKAKGAVFEEAYGYERPRWVASRDVARMSITIRSGGMSFTTSSAKKCATVRERVGIMDIISLHESRGSRYRRFNLSRSGSIANRLPKKVGGIILTHLLNERGRIEIELTVVRFGEDVFLL